MRYRLEASAWLRQVLESRRFKYTMACFVADFSPICNEIKEIFHLCAVQGMLWEE